MYILPAIILLFVLIPIIVYFTTRRKEIKPTQEDRIDRRQAYRLHVKNKMCNIQPLFSSSRDNAIICDISSTGIRIETKADSLTVKALLLIYFYLDEESFIIEGIVKRKQSIGPGRDQYGIKFIFLNETMQKSLQNKLNIITKKIAQ
jgi:hypothetical protein